MKKTALLLIIFAVCMPLVFCGCSSAQKKLSEEVKGIKTRVDTLETRVESVETKQTETERMAAEQAKEVEEMRARKERAAARSNIGIKHKNSPRNKERIREIQTCLKNAGFYQGEVDGVKGRKTRSAIKKFQRENGLNADGVVGRKTWEALSKYSPAGAAAVSAESPVEEEAATK
jgi:peptidoglycan hydrolase-like protein with peptidoglycan-binding domain